MSKELKNFSDNELLEEIERRKTSLPKQLENIDDTNLRAYLKHILKSIKDNNYMDEDNKHGIYEEVMKTYYGRDIFDWINNQIEY